MPSGVIVGPSAFLAGYILSGAALVGAGLTLDPAGAGPGGELLDRAALAGYLLIVQALINTAAFLAVTAAASRWRRLPRRRLAAAASTLGVAAQLGNWLGLWVLAAPAAALLGAGTMWLMFALPGLLAGLLAIVLGRVLRVTKTPTHGKDSSVESR